MPARPDVSVVIPTRNRWRLLSTAALPSALGQEGVDLEVVVVDDGSTDDSAERAESLDDPRVRLLRHERRRGVAAARNTGIAAARGAWLAFLDDDDLWSPTKLQTQLAAAHALGASLVFGGVVVLDERLEVDHVTRPAVDTGATLASDLLERNTIPAGSSNVLVATHLVRDAGGFDERLTYTEDWDLWLRIAGSATAAALQELLVAYVRHPLATQFAGARAVRELRYFAAKHRERGLTADPARFLRWIASEHRAAGRRSQAASTYFLSGVALRRPGHLVHAAASVLDANGSGLLGGFREVPARVELPPEPPWLEPYRRSLG